MVVIVESVEVPRPTSIRVAKAFARAELADVVVCHWRALDFSANSVGVRGAIYTLVGDGAIRSATLRDTNRATALFFFAPESGLDVDERDLEALQRFEAAGVAVEKAPPYLIVEQLMLESSRRGLVTNALGSDFSWGSKYQQELRLRQYEEARGNLVSRPRTYIADKSRIASALAIFANLGQICIVKPALGEGGNGIKIVRPGELPPWITNVGEVVVQLLMPNPLLIDGYKVDLRSYLLVDADDKQVSGRLAPIFVRRAAAAYTPGTLAGEITNTSARLRQGLPADINPLEHIGSIGRGLREAISAQLDLIAGRLAEAYFWAVPANAATRAMPMNRVMLFGVDVVVTMSANEPRLYLLEINPFPALFRGSFSCDRAVDEMLAMEYLPRLLRSGHGAAVRPAGEEIERPAASSATSDMKTSS